MPRIDFTQIEDTSDYAPLPDGEYRCHVDSVDERTTQRGDPMWRLRFRVVDGDFEGRWVWDNLVFSERGRSRVKLFCKSIGIDTSQAVDLLPEMLIGKTCKVTVFTEEYLDHEDVRKKCNSVPFAGFAPDTPF